MDASFQEKINQAASIIKNSKKAVAFTGAGISTHSGIADFRSPESGLWNKYDPFEVASLTAFRNHPDKFYDWIRPLTEIAQAAKPNPGHIALAQLENAGFIQAVITQNIDGLHQKAGSQRVIELHGSSRSATCLSCGMIYAENWLPEDFISSKDIPYCKKCNGILKPDVILFEEMLPAGAWREAQSLCEAVDLVIVVGSSLEVYPANSLPEIALRRGANLIINTLTKTHMDLYADVVIQADLVETMPPICELVLDQ